MAAKAKAKSDGAEKVEKAEKVPKSPVKSPKSKKDGVKNAPMKKKAAAKVAPKHPATSKMVADAFETLKNRKGNSLAAIRNYIEKNFDVKVDKRLHGSIKKYIGAEFEAGRIKMVGDDSDEIKYNQRFALVK